MRSRRRRIQRHLSIALVIGLVLALASSVTAASAASNTNTTVVVTNSDISTGQGTGTGWYTADTRTGGTVETVSGPSPTPMGSGSLHMTTTDQNGGSGQAKAQLFTYQYIGTPLANIDAMSYSDYRSSSSTTNSGLRVALNMEVDFVGDGSSYTTLVFEPIYQAGGVNALQSDTWQTWDAYNGGNAIWWSTKDIPGVCAFNCFVSWNSILAANPNAKIKNGFGFNVGSGWAGVSDENADALKVGISGSTTTYDFEKTPPLLCRVMIWSGSNQPCSFSGPSWFLNIFGGNSGFWWLPHFGGR